LINIESGIKAIMEVVKIYHINKGTITLMKSKKNDSFTGSYCYLETTKHRIKFKCNPVFLDNDIRQMSGRIEDYFVYLIPYLYHDQRGSGVTCVIESKYHSLAFQCGSDFTDTSSDEYINGVNYIADSLPTEGSAHCRRFSIVGDMVELDANTLVELTVIRELQSRVKNILVAVGTM
jgi:hypothetical protein